jgi:hypothetical protein
MHDYPKRAFGGITTLKPTSQPNLCYVVAETFVALRTFCGVIEVGSSPVRLLEMHTNYCTDESRPALIG